MSLMKRHQQAVRTGTAPARQESQPTAVIGIVPTGLMAARKLGNNISATLQADLQRLSAFKSVERKQELKRDELLPKYTPYVQRLQAEGQQHELLGWYLVWLLDAGEIERGLEYGQWCIANGVSLPEKFRRDVPTYLADAVADWAEPLTAAGQSTEPYLTRLVHAADGLCSQWDIPDALSARLVKAHADALAGSDRWEQAVEAYEIALELGAKVKTVLATARKQLEKAAP